MKINDVVGGILAQFQCERARTQMTLGKLISALKVMPNEAMVSNLNNAHSYRGYYSDLAFERGIGEIPASELLSACQSAIDKVFEGYKGGDFLMGAHTPVWVANYGQEGSKLIAIGCDGEIETAQDD